MLRSRVDKAAILAIVCGIVPVKLREDRFKICSVLVSPRASGIVPVTPVFSVRIKEVKASRDQTKEGIVPVKVNPLKSMLCTVNPLAVHTTPGQVQCVVTLALVQSQLAGKPESVVVSEHSAAISVVSKSAEAKATKDNKMQ